MKYTLLFVLLVLAFSCASPVSQLHRRAILTDTHNDVLSSRVLGGHDISRRLSSGHSDLHRWKEGGVDVQFFSVWTGEQPRQAAGFFADALEEIDSLHRIILRNPDRMTFATRYRDIRRWAHKDKLVSLIGVEGGHMIENSLDKLQTLYDKGMRYLTLTWNNSTDWASSARDETRYPERLKQKGLTSFGREVVRRLNELGVIVDLSHTGEQTFYDALAVSKKPVLLSHSSVWALCPVFRNLKDDQIRAVAQNGGVICINFFAGFIDSVFSRRFREAEEAWTRQQSAVASQPPGDWDEDTARDNFLRQQLEAFRPPLAKLVDHIDYIVRLVGEDYVGLGSDFDGVSFLPAGLDDVSRYPRITEELVRRGYSPKAVRKILGGNVLRVVRANLH